MKTFRWWGHPREPAHECRDSLNVLQLRLESTLWLAGAAVSDPLVPSVCARRCPTSRLDRRHEWLHADDVHDTREIVGEHMQRHLGGNLRQALHQKVRRTHPHLERAEGALDRLTTHAHRLRVLIETLLHSVEQVFVLPSRDASLGSRRALRFKRATRAGRRPIAAQCSASFYRVQLLARGTAVDILRRHEVVLAEAAI